MAITSPRAQPHIQKPLNGTNLWISCRPVEIPATVHAPNQTNKNKMTKGFFRIGIEIRRAPASYETVERIGYGEITGVIDFEEMSSRPCLHHRSASSANKFFKRTKRE